MKVLITHEIPEIGINMLKDKGYEVDIAGLDTVTSKPYDAVLTFLTDTVNKEVFDKAPTVKVFANYAIGYNNFDVEEAKKRGIHLTNTPGGGADHVAEHTWALILSLSCNIAEGDRYVREGRYKGWDAMLMHGVQLKGKTLGIIGSGRIGADVAHRGKYGFEMNIAYYDVKRNEQLEKDLGATFYPTVDEVLKVSDIVSIHVPLLPTTQHLINSERLSMMKKDAILVNTSRGPVIDEKALVEALKNKTIRGAGLDVFESEPALAEGLKDLSNVVMTPHIASATDESRREMATMAAENIIAVLESGVPKNPVI